MVLWYWWYRYVNAEKLTFFVKGVTEVTLTMLPERQIQSQGLNSQ